MTKDKIKQLLDKYAKGTCTVEERQLLELWFEQREINDQHALSVPDKIRLWQQIEAKTEHATIEITSRPRYYRWAAAAAILISLAVSTYFVTQRQTGIDKSSELVSTEILPGENKAVLTLSDGRQISLADNHTETTNDQGISITRTAEGMLQYKIDPNLTVGKGYNTIATPRGGQYEIILPDGSKATLNAESSLRFAVDMHHQAKRIVDLKGEGYFDVAKDARRPFVVKSEQQEIQVLGTVFNVNTYHASRSLTTLLEGSVLINKKQKLRPGQQAQVEGNQVSIQEVDVNDFVDWKNNAFIFRNESLESIMERVGRWYNVEYTFQDLNTRKITFNGEISRYAKVEDVLNLLKMTSKVKFDIQGRSITIK